VIYNFAKLSLAEEQINLSADTIGILLTNGYTADQTDQYVSDVTDETSGTNYYRQDLTGTGLYIDTTNDRATFSADSVTWDLATFAADGAVIYKNTGDDTTSVLIAYLDFGTIKSSDNTPFVIEWSEAEGILQIR
jgi:hypothetical protein